MKQKYAQDLAATISSDLLGNAVITNAGTMGWDVLANISLQELYIDDTVQVAINCDTLADIVATIDDMVAERVLTYDQLAAIDDCDAWARAVAESWAAERLYMCVTHWINETAESGTLDEAFVTRAA